MCEQCWSGFDPSPFKKKATQVGEETQEKKVEKGGHSWEKDPRSRDQFMEFCRGYMEHVFEEYGFNVLKQDMISMRDSAKMSSSLGRCTSKAAYNTEIIVSWHAYDSRDYDWDRVRETVRHELTHASTYAEYGYMGHGPTFIEEAKRLDVENIERYDEPDPRYFIICRGCGAVLWRQKRSKKVKEAQASPKALGSCANCGTHHWDVVEDNPADVHSVWTQKNV